MDPFLLFLTVVITVLTIVLVVVGVHLIMILRNLNHTLTQANRTIDTFDTLIHNIKNPLSDVHALSQGVKTGLSVAQNIVSWVKQKKDPQESREET